MLFELDPTFRSADAKYVQFNFHPQAQIDALRDVLTSVADNRARIVRIFGEPQTGRRYVAEAAVHSAARLGYTLRYMQLDLRGYEPTSESLEAYVTHLLSQNNCKEQSRVKAVADKFKVQLKAQTPTLWGASILSLAATADLSLADLSKLFGNACDALPGVSRTPRERFAITMEALAQDARAVIHVLDPDSLSRPLYEWFIDQLAAGLNAVVLFSTLPKQFIQTRDLPDAVFEIARLREPDIAAILDERFAPNEFDSALVRPLWYYSEGYCGRLAIKMADLVQADLVTQDRSGVWRLETPEGADVVSVFGVDEIERVREAVSAVPQPFVEEMRRFVETAALCSGEFPVKALATCAGIDELSLDAFIDVLDDSFDPALFEDLGYNHVSFPGDLVYIFANPITPEALARSIPASRQETLAEPLLQHLLSTRGVRTRGMARLCRSLTMRRSSGTIPELEPGLSWWIGLDEADDLAQWIRTRLLSGELDPHMLIREVARHRRRDWPPYRCVAVLEACIDEHGQWEIEAADVGTWHLLYSSSLRDSGRTRDALSAALYGLTLVQPDSELCIELLITCGVCQRFLGDLSTALTTLLRASEMAATVFGDDYGRRIEADNALAGLCRTLDRLGQAEALFRKALTYIERARSGSISHAIALDNLSCVYSDLERFDEALEMSKTALALFTQILGERHLDTTAAMSNVGTICVDLGRWSDAEAYLKKALPIVEEQCGPDSVNIAPYLDNLGRAYFEQGKYEQSISVGSRCVEIYRATWGDDAPDTFIALENLSHSCEHGGHYTAALSHVDRLIELTPRLHGFVSSERYRALLLRRDRLRPLVEGA